MNNDVVEAYNKWLAKIPKNRPQKRKQLHELGYYYVLEGGETLWTLYGIKKNGKKIIVDKSTRYKEKTHE